MSGVNLRFNIWRRIVASVVAVMLSAGVIVQVTAGPALAAVPAGGSVYTGFNPGATLTGGVNSVLPVTVAGEERYLVGGGFTDAGPALNDYVAILNSDGSVYPDFAPANAITGIVNSAALITVADAAKGDQKYLLGGDFTDVGTAANDRVVILNADGTVYTGFNPVGNIALTIASGPSSVLSVASVQVAGQQRFLLGGTFADVGTAANDLAVILNKDGTVYTGFSPGNLLTTDLAHTGLKVESVASVQVGGQQRFLLGGTFSTDGSTPNLFVTVLDEAGSSYVGFTSASIIGGTIQGPLVSVATPVTVVDPVKGNQKFLIGGDFTTTGGIANTSVAILNEDGTVYTGFTPGTVLDGTYGLAAVETAMPTMIGGAQRYLLGGNLIGIGTDLNNGVVILNADGTVYEGFKPGPEFPEFSPPLSMAEVSVAGGKKYLLGGLFADIGTADNDNLVILNGLPTPSATATTATNVMTTTATGNGTVTANGFASIAPGAVCRIADTEEKVNSDTPAYYLETNAAPNTFTEATESLSLACGFTGLAPGTEYFYKILATNSEGIGESNVVSFTTVAAPVINRPGKPIKLRVKGKPNSVTRKISWQAPTSGGPPNQYQAVIRQTGFKQALISRVISSLNTSIEIKRQVLLRKSVLARGDVRTVIGYRVTVTARNSAGTSQLAQRSFVIKI